jgi:hypothetical protein
MVPELLFNPSDIGELFFPLLLIYLKIRNLYRVISKNLWLPYEWETNRGILLPRSLTLYVMCTFLFIILYAILKYFYTLLPS